MACQGAGLLWIDCLSLRSLNCCLLQAPHVKFYSKINLSCVAPDGSVRSAFPYRLQHIVQHTFIILSYQHAQELSPLARMDNICFYHLYALCMR